VALFPQSFIDDLRLQANILQVVQEYVQLRKVGTSYKGLCPFHSEKTPSFVVHPDKGFFHCFGCRAGGDVFKFLELHEKLGFQEAVRFLAQRVGMPLPETSNDGDDQQRQSAAVRESMLKMHEIATAYFRKYLASPAGGRARQQLAERGLQAQTIEQLGLGFAPVARDGLKSVLLEQGFSRAQLVQSGLVTERDSGELVDRFRNRLMMPICRDSGSVVAFGGRAMDAEQVPKYLNSPETPIYSKSRTVYGLHLTKSLIRTQGFVVLVEGYFDFAQVFQAQAAPVVATCGTALTPQQAQLLRRFTEKVVLSYDPDTAGQTAAARSSELLVREGFGVNVVELDRGMDPDAFVRRHGGESYRQRLRQSRPYLEYLMDQESRGQDFRDGEVQRAFLAKMLAIAAWLPGAAARDQFADKVAHKANITAEVVRHEFRRLAAKRQTGLGTAELPGLVELKKVEKALIWWIVQRPADVLDLLPDLSLDDLRPSVARRALDVVRDLNGVPPEQVPAALIQRLSEEDSQVVSGIAAESAPPAKSLTECLGAIRRLRLDDERAELQRRIDELQGQGVGRNDDEIARLYHKKIALMHRMEELT
jgi:DNA primase